VNKWIRSLGLLTLITSSSLSFASMENALSIYQSGDKSRYPQLVNELLDEGMYFSSIPFIKEYLATTNKVNDAAVDKILDKAITEVGVKQFELLPESILGKSNAPTIRYILARKAFRQGKYDLALKFLDKEIEDWNPVKPYALMLEGSIYSLTKKEMKAVETFNECVKVSQNHLSKESNKDRLRQLKINRDYCIVGIPRSQFAMTKYDAAYTSYLDLEKSSYIWPEILFEEAWNSFYLKDYNRTLGKLVTYKAPVFNYILNPEIEVLKALAYMELCLWDDSKKSVESFYSNNEKEYQGYKKAIDSLGKDYKQYFTLISEFTPYKSTRNEILNSALMTISKDPAYLELYSSYNAGRGEIDKLKALNNEKLKMLLGENLKEALVTQRNLIGSYVRGQLQLYSAQFIKAFEDMSYIKLEILDKRKTELYEDISYRSGGRSRGNFAYLKKTDRQYFWTFNGEFWADELGDYVFSLKSECK
jgi:hypothetical protein